MCGIAGILSLNTEGISVENLYKMTSSMVNRGPDDEGYFLYDTTFKTCSGNDTIVKNTPHILEHRNTKFKVGFGFRQLKIIDLSNASHQPMSDTGKNYWIVFNGEIYNFLEIRKELESLNYKFHSNSDTEVLLNSYIQWGENCLQKLNGMFAFAIFDKNKNEVFIARDRIGIKPLHYYFNGKVFVFGSTINSIISSELFEAKIDYEGLWQNFKFSMAQRPKTCIENIKGLKPGHFIKVNLNSNKIQQKQYWEIPVGTQDHSLSEKKAASLLEESLYDAVQYRMKADVELGSFMSGGIDSTTISVLASKFNPNIKTLTLGFSEFSQYNEIKEAKETAVLNNLTHIVSSVKAEDVLKNVPLTTIAYEEPYYHLAANFEISKLAAENNLKVVLNGLGGDELFGGYDVYHKLKYWNTLKSNKNLLKILPNFHKKINKIKQLSTYKEIAEFYSHYYTNYTDQDLNRLFVQKSFNTTNCLEETYKPNISFEDSFEAISFYNLKSYIGNHQMRSSDAATMYHSIEGRFPLLDHNFIKTAYQIPTKYKITNGEQKAILKQVAKKHIAPSCFKMNKKGLRLPLEHWINNELKQFVFDNINDLKKRNIFNNNEIERIVINNETHKIWQLVSTQMWLNNLD